MAKALIYKHCIKKKVCKVDSKVFVQLGHSQKIIYQNPRDCSYLVKI